MDFEKSCMVFTMQEPFYGILLSSMERIPTDKIDTLGVMRSGNVFKLLYNKSFVEPLPLDVTVQLLKHEVLHVAFNHFTLFEDDNVPDGIKTMRNIATDMEVNGYLDVNKFRYLHPVLCEDFGWDRHLGSREYYSRLEALANQKQQKQQAQQPQQPCNGGQGGSSQPQQQQKNTTPQQQQSQGQGSPQSGDDPQDCGFQPQETPSLPKDITDKYQQIDDHSLWPKDMSEQEMQDITNLVDTMLDFAAQEVEKSCGTIPSELVGRIEKVRKKPRPVTDWKRYFRRYLGNEFTEFIRKSKKRESRRFPDAAGNRYRRKSHILVAIDTSGSVSMPEYKEFMGQIKTLTATADFHVVECDARIQYEYEFKNKPNEILHGGGGTDFQPVIDMFNKDKRKYDALVYFTDGYCHVPKDTPKETLWVISSNGTDDRKPFRKNGASVVKIPKKSI